MIVIPDSVAGLASLDAWWPTSAEEVQPLLAAAPMVRARQTSETVAAGLGRWVFRRRPSPTLLVDLTLSEEDLWLGLHPKSCRAKIRKAEAIGCRVLLNEDVVAARRLIDMYIASERYTRPLADGRWAEILERSDVFGVAVDGRLLAAHVILRDDPRVRMLFSATVDRSGRDQDRMVGAANRYLHWRELLHYRERGACVYDFGGIDLDSSAPRYGVTEFKRSFGGRMVVETTVYLARNPLLRATLKAVSEARLALGKGARSTPAFDRR